MPRPRARSVKKAAPKKDVITAPDIDSSEKTVDAYYDILKKVYDDNTLSRKYTVSEHTTGNTGYTWTNHQYGYNWATSSDDIYSTVIAVDVWPTTNENLATPQNKQVLIELLDEALNDIIYEEYTVEDLANYLAQKLLDATQ